jgi:hypothetical protein
MRAPHEHRARAPYWSRLRYTSYTAINHTTDKTYPPVRKILQTPATARCDSFRQTPLVQRACSVLLEQDRSSNK